MTEHSQLINEAFADRGLLKEAKYEIAVLETLEHLDQGRLRVAEPVEDGWVVHQWLQKAVVLYFAVRHMDVMRVPPFEYHDKIPLKRRPRSTRSPRTA